MFRVQREADAARHEAQAARCDAEAAAIELRLRGIEASGHQPSSVPAVPGPVPSLNTAVLNNTTVPQNESGPGVSVRSYSSPQPACSASTAVDTTHPNVVSDSKSKSASHAAEITWYQGPQLDKPTTAPLDPSPPPTTAPADQGLPAAALASTSFQSWQEIREAFDHDADATKTAVPTKVDTADQAAASSDGSSTSVAEPDAAESPVIIPAAGDPLISESRKDKTAAPQLRVDAAHHPVTAPQLRNDDAADDVDLDKANGKTTSDPLIAVAASAATTDSPSHADTPFPLISTLDSDEKPFEKAEIVELDSAVVADDTTTPENRRRKPAAWVASAIVHAVILVILGVVTLKTHKPLDQVSLSASAPSASEVSMETFSIESTELETEPTEEQTESEIQYDLSPVGEIAISNFTPPPPPSMPSPAAAMLSPSNNSAAAMLTKPSDSDAKIQFCGVDGGGNHFVYLVDSSKSMGDAFNSARIELLKSINALRPDQRFYVIFFDSDPDFMRLSDPKKDERRSAYATPKNKAALQRWAMGIRADRGRNPNDLLDFVLKLRADAIFLLSDGEFPQSTEQLLQEKNVQRNLFGSGGLISRVHTIAYHSRAGESRMKRIAQQHQGQYRYIAKP
ncbi:hypothetical protein RMSM_06651 [Rhodopirellula maiorica SM1]|uniref:VWFA domain-containing protein n=1 Tax=Rhodopirellula maiorica SM1 TaxID=1265738 RepID=M5RA85_9BACT|nr:hypothetical protein RMSM_06651 [Rhodopirellula maiorica SM1]